MATQLTRANNVSARVQIGVDLSISGQRERGFALWEQDYDKGEKYLEQSENDTSMWGITSLTRENDGIEGLFDFDTW